MFGPCEWGEAAWKNPRTGTGTAYLGRVEMIIRKDQAPVVHADEEDTQYYGPSEWLHLSDEGGLTQFGAHVHTLQPGTRSSDRHWHEEQDEFLYMLSGEATVIEEDGPHLLQAGVRRAPGPHLLMTERPQRPAEAPNVRSGPPKRATRSIAVSWPKPRLRAGPQSGGGSR